MSTKTPRTQTGLIPTTHKNEMNRLASPEAIVSLPPKPPPIHHRFKGEKKQATLTLTLPRRRKSKCSITQNEWNSSLVEKSRYMHSSIEIRKKENGKNAVQHFLRSSAKKRQQLEILEKRLNDEIQNEQESIESIPEHMNHDLENRNPSNLSVEKQFTRLRKSLVSRLNECNEESLTDKVDSIDTSIESSQTSKHGFMHNDPNHATMKGVRSMATPSEETSFDPSWEILLPDQRCRIQMRMKEIYMSKYSHNIMSQHSKDLDNTNHPFDNEKELTNKVSPRVANENKRHEEDLDVTLSSSLNNKSIDTDDCVSSLIESIAEGFQIDFENHVNALNDDLAKDLHTNRLNSPESPLKKQPEHPYSLPLSEEFKISILQEPTSN